MNREIKFRVWCSNTFKYIPSDDYGFDCLDYDYLNLPVQQYTGLKDKNGKEIYEGDIIHCRWWFTTMRNPIYDYPKDDYLDVYYEILWKKDRWVPKITKYQAFGTCIKEKKNPYNYSCDDAFYKCEVAGNIYENPELLK